MENRRIIVLFAAHGDSVEKNLMAQVNMEEFGRPCCAGCLINVDGTTECGADFIDNMTQYLD